MRDAGEPPQTDDPRAKRLPVGVKLAYGLPSIAGAAMAIPIAIHMTKFYSDTVGLALGYIAIAQAIARAFDAVTDPLMGWISDHTRSRLGRRRPWMLIGAPLCALAFFALFTPPQGIGEAAGAVWFTACYVLYFLFHTVYVIPHYGLGPELTQDYHERSSLFAYRDGTSLLGTMLAAVIPGLLVVALVKSRDLETADAERIAYSGFAAVMGALLVLLYGWLCFRVKENPEFSARAPNPFVPGVRRVVRNRPFLVLLGVYAIASIPAAIPGIFMPFFTQYVLKIENWQGALTAFLGAYFLSGFLSIPFWLMLARRLGKKEAWILSSLLGIAASLTLFAIPSVLTGSASFWPVLGVLFLAGAGFGAGMFLNPSMQGDVIDYDELYTGKRREAQYGALWAFATKFVVIPSASVPLAVLATVGYVPNVEQSPEVILTLRIIFGAVPATFSLMALGLAIFYPVTERVHHRIAQGIDAHRRGETAIDPLTGREVPPPGKRGIDEDVSWYLDHFSRGELERVLERGPSGLRPRALLLAAGCIALSALCFAETVLTLGNTDVKPGPITVGFVMIGGISFAGALFHLIRARAAGRAADVPLEDIRAHLKSQAALGQ